MIPRNLLLCCYAFVECFARQRTHQNILKNPRNISTVVTLSISSRCFRRHCSSTALMQVNRAVADTCARTKRGGSATSASQLSGLADCGRDCVLKELRVNQTCRSQNRAWQVAATALGSSTFHVRDACSTADPPARSSSCPLFNGVAMTLSTTRWLLRPPSIYRHCCSLPIIL